ncbi:MAG: sulfurtransferase [Candidatus Tectimicrobiota bacterium]|nr:MAG: sulfurtransferase [Candidatus Tectomicrobia bacterium]
MVQSLTPHALRALLASEAPHALLDVRELGEYNSAHIPGASAVPRRLLEFRLPRLVPCRHTQLVVYDDDGRRARLAAATLERMGYTQVAVLEGGLKRWASLGYRTEWGVNVPSKDFGEKVQVQYQVPEMHPEALWARLQRGETLVILDARTPEEHRRATIPGSRSLPGGELALRIAEVVPTADTPIVVHCAGRTRSLVGARLLQRMGFPHVYALRNGTMGWALAGLALEEGSTRFDLPAPSPAGLAAAERFAERVAAEDGVQRLGVAELQALMARRTQENIYLIDVRTAEEFAQGHIPGFWWVPGGQAVQRADDVVAVRRGHVVFACDGRVRALVTASWYRQLGFPHVYAVDGGTRAWQQAGLPLAQGGPESLGAGYDAGLDAMPWGFAEARARVTCLTATALQEHLQRTPTAHILFVGTSREFSRAHLPGARWLLRSWLELDLPAVAPDKATPLVLTCADGYQAVLAAATLEALGYRQVVVLDGGMQAWQQAGLPVEQGLSGVMAPPNDVLPMGTERSWAEAIHYLQWEEDLGAKYHR